MKKISVFTNYNIPDKSEIAFDVVRRFSSLGAEVSVPGYVRSIARDLPAQYVPNAKLYDNADLAVVIGGDGSILDTSRRVCEAGVPILGINKGRLGYMTELEVSELDLIGRIMEGNYSIDERSMLGVTVKSGDGIVYQGSALNDAVISNGSVARLIDFRLSVSDAVIGDYRSDGVILATPTGSTAYSLSAGGPILDPKLNVVCVTFICAHSLNARPMVFDDTNEITVLNTCSREPYIYLTLDGHTNVRVYRNQSVSVRRSVFSTKLVRVKSVGFYSGIFNKLKGI